MKKTISYSLITLMLGFTTNSFSSATLPPLELKNPRLEASLELLEDDKSVLIKVNHNSTNKNEPILNIIGGVLNCETGKIVLSKEFSNNKIIIDKKDFIAINKTETNTYLQNFMSQFKELNCVNYFAKFNDGTDYFYDLTSEIKPIQNFKSLEKTTLDMDYEILMDNNLQHNVSITPMNKKIKKDKENQIFIKILKHGRPLVKIPTKGLIAIYGESGQVDYKEISFTNDVFSTNSKPIITPKESGINIIKIFYTIDNTKYVVTAKTNVD